MVKNPPSDAGDEETGPVLDDVGGWVTWVGLGGLGAPLQSGHQAGPSPSLPGGGARAWPSASGMARGTDLGTDRDSLLARAAQDWCSFFFFLTALGLCCSPGA